MSRRIRPEIRCPRCQMRRDLCYCPLIEPIESKTKLLVLMHSYEQHKPSSTVRLLQLILPSAEVHTFGGRVPVPGITPLQHSVGTRLLLFPSPDAPVLDQEFARNLPSPVTLVVPDGTWHQAKRFVNHRLLGLQQLPRARLVSGAPSAYKLRKSETDDGLCTLEAVARALGILEGQTIQEHLEKHLAMLVERVLWGRFSSARFPDPFGRPHEDLSPQS